MIDNVNHQLTLLDKQAGNVLLQSERYKTYWTDEDDAYWLMRLMEEVGELAASLANDHDDKPELELEEIASICINWLRKREREQNP